MAGRGSSKCKGPEVGVCLEGCAWVLSKQEGYVARPPYLTGQGGIRFYSKEGGNRGDFGVQFLFFVFFLTFLLFSRLATTPLSCISRASAAL